MNNLENKDNHIIQENILNNSNIKLDNKHNNINDNTTSNINENNNIKIINQNVVNKQSAEVQNKVYLNEVVGINDNVNIDTKLFTNSVNVRGALFCKENIIGEGNVFLKKIETK